MVGLPEDAPIHTSVHDETKTIYTKRIHKEEE